MRTNQNTFDHRNEEYELSKAAIQVFREELRLQQHAAIADRARTQTEMAGATSVLQSRMVSRESEMLVCFEEKQRLLEAALVKAQQTAHAEEMKAITAASECMALTRNASQDATSYALSVRNTVGAIQQIARDRITQMGQERQDLELQVTNWRTQNTRLEWQARIQQQQLEDATARAQASERTPLNRGEQRINILAQELRSTRDQLTNERNNLAIARAEYRDAAQEQITLQSYV